MSSSRIQLDADKTIELVAKCIAPLQDNIKEHGSPILVREDKYKYTWEYDDGYIEVIDIASV